MFPSAGKMTVVPKNRQLFPSAEKQTNVPQEITKYRYKREKMRFRSRCELNKLTIFGGKKGNWFFSTFQLMGGKTDCRSKSQVLRDINLQWAQLLEAWLALTSV